MDSLGMETGKIPDSNISASSAWSSSYAPHFGRFGSCMCNNATNKSARGFSLENPSDCQTNTANFIVRRGQVTTNISEVNWEKQEHLKQLRCDCGDLLTHL